MVDLDRRKALEKLLNTGLSAGALSVAAACSPREERRADGQAQGASTSVPASGSASVPAPNPSEGAELIGTPTQLGAQWETSDPFLFCAHHNDAYPAGNADYGPQADLAGRRMGQDFGGKDGWSMYHGRRVPGFPRHPHRGFETVTVVRRGLLDHSDSLGARARYGNGDVQWLTAGKGINHAEMFPLLRGDAPNPLELFQIWVNLPAARKMVPPAFKMFWNEDIPERSFADAAGRSTQVRVIAGRLGEATAPSAPPNSWAAQADANVAIWTIKLQAGATWRLPEVPAGVERSVYFHSGTGLRLGGKAIADYHRVVLQGPGAVAIEGGPVDCEVLLLQGRPIAEPVARQGPFVMNTRAEIRQAFADYRATGFGGWPWSGDDPVHGGELERFAELIDGSEDRPA